MKPGLASTGDKFFVKAFNRGLLATFFVYFLLFAWAYMHEKGTIKELQRRMPARVVSVERPPAPEPEPVVEAYNFPPAPAAQTTGEAANDDAEPAPSVTVTDPVETAQTDAPGASVKIPAGPLEAAPINGLYENTPLGKLPRISSAGLTPFDAYRRPFVYHGQPVIVLAVRDYGLSPSASEQALSLPPDVTLILSPYSENPDMWQKKAREAGHEIWIGLPLENTRFLHEDPGPQALLVNSNLSENQAKLNWVLSRTTGYAGIVAETDRAFLEMHSMLGALLTSVFKRGLGYFELNTTGSEFVETLAVANGSPFAAQSQSISDASEATLYQLETLARNDGFVIATIDLTPRNLDNLRLWVMTLQGKGVSLAPVSAVAATKIAPSNAGTPAAASQ